MKMLRKKINLTTNISMYMGHRHFVKFCFVHIVKISFVFKNSHYAYIPPYMHKILPTLGNEKEKHQKF